MEYVQPVGEADPNASYKDRNTGAGEPGSRVPARAIEHPQREIVTVIESAGLTPSRSSVSQLDEAIDLKIAQALGSGENPLNDLLTILRARNPIFPVINTVGNTFNLSVPSTGVLRIPAGISITHRGCFNDTTSEQDFNTVANKTYHLRKRWFDSADWDPGWELVDVSNSTYNPSALAEGNVAFDTSFDDMISHRVVTDASNVATITALKNAHKLTLSGETYRTGDSFQDNLLPSQVATGLTVNQNFARRPQAALAGVTDLETYVAAGVEISAGIRVNSRYTSLLYWQIKGSVNAEAGQAYEVWA